MMMALSDKTKAKRRQPRPRPNIYGIMVKQYNALHGSRASMGQMDKNTYIIDGLDGSNT